VKDRIPYPTLHGGLTPDDIPYGYSAYRTVFDDGTGYEPQIVGIDETPESRLVIMVALSPGTYVACTMVLAGQDPEQASDTVLDAFQTMQSPGVLSCDAPQTGSARAPDVGADNREVCQ
jgi:hypothetical protein